jgi:hypothetical protein
MSTRLVTLENRHAAGQPLAALRSVQKRTDCRPISVGCTANAQFRCGVTEVDLPDAPSVSQTQELLVVARNQRSLPSATHPNLGAPLKQFSQIPDHALHAAAALLVELADVDLDDVHAAGADRVLESA